MADLFGSFNPYATGGYQYANPASGLFQQPAQQQGPFTVRESGNVAEVLAAQIGVGTTNVFLNLPAGEIYISKHDNMGKKEVSVYRFDQIVQQSILSTRQDTAPAELAAVRAELAEIKAMLSGGKINELGTDNQPIKGRSKPASGYTANDADASPASAK